MGRCNLADENVLSTNQQVAKLAIHHPPLIEFTCYVLAALDIRTYVRTYVRTYICSLGPAQGVSDHGPLNHLSIFCLTTLIFCSTTFHGGDLCLNGEIKSFFFSLIAILS